MLITACSSTPPARQDYLLQTQRSGTSQSAQFGALQVNELRSTAPYRDMAFLYKESEQRFVADPYHGFLATPTVQITQQTRQWLAQSGLFSQVYPTGSSLIAPWQLEGELLAMYIDVSDVHHPKVLIRVQFLLSNHAKSESFTLTAEQVIADAQPETAAKGYQQALASLLNQLEQHLISSNLN
ncbi:hypothetical protein HQ393_00170 [Chitinibacter bivalviorum]|uniref:ABC-type transport auxiliary lipoprotein component domain-containing protein n=1 Tax=Chitinibacter bivalviorum TaxID=2739434 RepID=A0A7H9BFU3_9NEIS|nr:hypothetical protein [Chitinibacter bivalviorum]QLG86781.1 hypothetical protein HQ393_00170 [Chitinibacter bivalviorum]